MKTKIFDRFLTNGTLAIVDADGSSRQFGCGAPFATMRLNRRGTLTRILRNPELNLGETYLAGEWDVIEGSLHDLLTILRTNLERHAGRSRLARALALMLVPWNHVAASHRNVRHHYDLDETLFRACLDTNMHYSCAYYREANMSLEEAQQAKCDHIAAKLCLRPGMRVLDVGCGWGSLAMELAERHDVTVMGVTLSPEQLRVARSTARLRGLDNHVRFELQDYRQVEESFDRIVSVGMFEHVGRRHYDEFFGKVEALLADDGVALLHTIGASSPPSVVNPWIERHIFPGGYIPSLSDVAPAVERSGLITADVEVLRHHYALTLQEWNRRFQQRRAEFAQSKGEAFCRMWEFYLLACQTAFEVSDLVVHHWQLAKRNLSVPTTRNYLYETQPYVKIPGETAAEEITLRQHQG
ncbi:MAG TPA: cyclopropane-fatty-acyl-phospholipid synthase family protein [Pseudomonadales bacterium]